MNTRQFQIGLATVVLLVVLRLALGCHFLYEGVWKIRHRDEFTAEPFLTQAKGPLSGVFYAMLDDMHRIADNHQCLLEAAVRAPATGTTWD